MARIYPDGMHTTIAQGIVENLGDGCVVRTVTLDDPEHGLTDEVLEQTDVLTWWGHAAHDEVDDGSSNACTGTCCPGWASSSSTPVTSPRCSRSSWGRRARSAGGTPTTASWSGPSTRPTRSPRASRTRSSSTRRRCTASSSTSPRRTSSSSSARSAAARCSARGCTFRRGHGKVFYFRPGDQDFPVYHHPNIQRILAGCVRFAAPTGEFPGPPPVERKTAGWFEGPTAEEGK